MSKDQEPKVTRAEQRARAYAKQLEEAGYTARVTIKIHEAHLYDSGEVMLPSLVSVRVYATGPGSLDDKYGFGFLSWLPAKGHRATTKFGGGNIYPPFGKIRKIKSERELVNRIAGEIFMAQYRASQNAGAEAAGVQS